MNEISFLDQFQNNQPCQLKNNWAKWNNNNNPAELRDIKREDGNYNNAFSNLYSYSPPFQEQQGYIESELKPSKNVHLSCNIPPNGQHQMDQTGYFYSGENHQVPGGEDSVNFDSSSNGEYFYFKFFNSISLEN